MSQELQEQLQQIALPNEWTDQMLNQIKVWEQEDTINAKSSVQTLHQEISLVQDKLDRLVDSYLDGDIPKENYLPKKEELLQRKLSLSASLKDSSQREVVYGLNSSKNGFWI